MPNAIKYSTTGDTLSLKKGNIFFGVGDVGKGPSSATTYYNGVTPSASGYTIYSYNASQTSKLSFHTAVDDAALRDYTNRVSGESFASAAQCLNWYATQTNYVCVNRDYEGIVTSGLTLCLDAGFIPSYQGSGTTWYDIAYSGFNGTLTNGPTYNSSNGGTIVFDGTNDYCDISTSQMTSSLITITGFIKWVAGTGGMFFGFTTYDVWTQSGNLGYNIGASDVYGISSATVTSLGLIGNWAHYTFVMTSTGSIPTNNKIYINGNLQTLAQRLGTTTNSPGFGSNLRLCSWNAGGFYGNLQYGSLQVYNRALTQTEITQNYNAQKSRYGL